MKKNARITGFLQIFFQKKFAEKGFNTTFAIPNDAKYWQNGNGPFV